MAVSNVLVRDFGGPAQFGAVYQAILGARATLDPASVAAGATGFDRVTIPGVLPGDMVIGLSLDAPAGGMTVQALVAAVNQVEVRYNNLTAGAVDLPSTTLRIIIGRTPL